MPRLINDPEKLKDEFQKRQLAEKPVRDLIQSEIVKKVGATAKIVVM